MNQKRSHAVTGYVALGTMLTLCGACAVGAEGEDGGIEATQEALVQSTTSATPAAASPGAVGATSAAAMAATSTTGFTYAIAGSLTLEQPIDREEATLSNKPFPTDFSGHGPIDRTLNKAYSLNQALTGVKWGEDTDDPCFLEAYFRNIATGAEGSDLTFDECDGHNPGNFKYATLPPDYFATGVRVCLNADGDKVKGVQLISQHILCILGADGLWVEGSDSTPVPGNGPEYVLHSDGERRFETCADLERDSVSDGGWGEHTNCDGDNDGPDSDWEAVVRCDGDNMVATGLNFGLEDGSGDRQMIEGISLQCHAARVL